MENSVAASEHLKKSPLFSNPKVQPAGLRSPSKLLHHNSTGRGSRSGKISLLERSRHYLFVNKNQLDSIQDVYILAVWGPILNENHWSLFWWDYMTWPLFMCEVLEQLYVTSFHCSILKLVLHICRKMADSLHIFTGSNVTFTVLI